MITEDRYTATEKELHMTVITSTIDYTDIKARQRDTWASGNYAVIGTTLQIVGESLAEAVDVQAGERVLDVAAGNGNASLAAARRGADVTATDYVIAASSSSGTGPPTTGSTRSARTTGRCSRRSRESTTLPEQRLSATCSPWPTSGIPRRPARCGSLATTSRSSR
jgi:hypothetical protein